VTDCTRRKFIIDSAKLTSAAISATALGGELLLPRPSEAAKIQFPVSSCGAENTDGRRILVTYTSQCGTTGEVAEAIGAVFCQGGDTADTRRIETVENLNDYDAVIIGSAIHQSKWMPEATKFVTTNQTLLSKRPIAYFFTCLTLSIDTEKSHRKAKGFLDPLVLATPEVKPVSVGRFAGVLDYRKLSFIYRTVMKRKMKKWGIVEGDYRDWSAIRSWAQKVCDRL
jgi:menaquinone-dependent protoporphyrinogen oxidase